MEKKNELAHVSLRSLLIVELFPTLGYPMQPTVMLSKEEQPSVYTNLNVACCPQMFRATKNLPLSKLSGLWMSL
jgi:hypothetical protein